MPNMVTRPVMASMASAIRLSWRMVVNVTSGWRHSKNGRMAGIGFCLPWLSLLRRPNTTTKADFFPHHFGEGIGGCKQIVSIAWRPGAQGAWRRLAIRLPPRYPLSQHDSFHTLGYAMRRA